MASGVLSKLVIISLFAAVLGSNAIVVSNAQLAQADNNELINGVVLKGVYVNMKQDDNGSPSALSNYIDSSLKMISEAGLNHVRFLFYWEAYEKNPE
ncbi:MAG: hypothetical protein WBP74_01070, partial [Nitrososphaeraceae archaeon]